MPPGFLPDLSFLPENVTIYFLKDIIGRKKAYLKNKQVVTLHVPQYKGLSLEKIMAFACQQQGLEKYLPDAPDLPKVPKQWIVNVCAAVLGDDFRAWVREQIEERNALMQQKKEMMIAIDPEMAAKFGASTHVSRKYLPLLPS